MTDRQIPVSNLALALRQDSKAFARVGEVVWMGGALDVPGNTTPSAEFNSFADPVSLQSRFSCKDRHHIVC